MAITIRNKRRRQREPHRSGPNPVVLFAVTFLLVGSFLQLFIHSRDHFTVVPSSHGGLEYLPPEVIERTVHHEQILSPVDSELFQRQNISFFRNLSCIYNWMNTTERRFSWHPLIVCVDRWAYKHVYKSGGTTCLLQCKAKTRQWVGVGDRNYFPVLSGKQLFSFVRDPIDHFVSGFSECAARVQKGGLHTKLQPTNRSILYYLRYHQRHVCFAHSIPQVEYFLDSRARYLGRIRFVGDMSVMKDFFISENLPWDDSKVEKRHYGVIKSKIPKNEAGLKKSKQDFIGLGGKLSDTALKRICKFVKIDYCFFDYTPPEVCRDEVEAFCHRTCPSRLL